jgi:hypothetical protein
MSAGSFAEFQIPCLATAACAMLLAVAHQTSRFPRFFTAADTFTPNLTPVVRGVQGKDFSGLKSIGR